MALTDEEIELLLNALAIAASRHEAQARWLGSGAFAAEHDDRAAAQRQLRHRLMKARQEQLT